MRNSLNARSLNADLTVTEQRARYTRIEQTFAFSEETFGDGATSLDANLTVA